MPAGRPTKYTPEIAQKICDAIRQGNYQAIAAKWVGIGEDTITKWKRIHPEFKRAILEAEAAAEIKLVALVMKAASEDPKHAEWLLAHKHPERWAITTKLAGKDGEPLQTNLSNITIFLPNNARDSQDSEEAEDTESDFPDTD